MAKVKVSVLKAGCYLQENMTAVIAEVGDVIEVKSGNYYERILDWGLVTPYAPALPGAASEPVAELREQSPAAPHAPVENIPSPDDPIGDLMEINGIGQKTAVKLVNGGIASKQAFVAHDAVELSEIAGTTVAKIQGWQAEAARLLEA